MEQTNSEAMSSPTDLANDEPQDSKSSRSTAAGYLSAAMAHSIPDQLPAQSDLEELAKLCQQIDKTCPIMYEPSQFRSGLDANGTDFRGRLLDEGRARLRHLVGQLATTSARLWAVPD